MSDLLPIKSAPKDKNILMWWGPKDANPHAECWIIAQVSSYEPGMFWDGHYEGGNYRQGYKSLSHIAGWTPLPDPPK